MLRRIDIANYKSISKLPIELGRFNVFIGENGAGKSNILEAIALASAAAGGKLDNEFLTARGVRVTRSELMRAAFINSAVDEPILLSAVHDNGERVEFRLVNDNEPYSKWRAQVSLDITRAEESHLDTAYRSVRSAAGQFDFPIGAATRLLAALRELENDPTNPQGEEKVITLNVGKTRHATEVTPEDAMDAEILGLLHSVVLKHSFISGAFSEYLIYSPENSALRTFAREGQIEPLGINGEGLLKLIHVHATTPGSTVLDEIREALKILGWFEDFAPSKEITDERLIIRDKYLADLPFDLDQKSANEGFLFLLFYFALFTSKLTPKFFAIDNIDASLNPKLCQKLTKELVRLSNANDKQVIVTTHNPAVLDGLNLDDDEQRLFVVSRGRDGATKLKRIHKPASDGPSYRLSELFLRGLLGGLPKGF